MKKFTAMVSVLVIGASLGMSNAVSAHSMSSGSPSTAGTQNMEPGMMSKNMMPLKGSSGYRPMMGHGMMMGHGSHHQQTATIDRNLSSDDVRKILEGHFVWMGHKRLKVGDVKSQDDGTLLADINTIDDSLVMRMEVDPKTGAMQMVGE